MKSGASPGSKAKPKLAQPRMATVTVAIEAWFAQNARDLPWRHARNGYSALVSELMLQQTQVARVLERYGPFMERFPTIVALAEARESAVLAAWQGLGYYRRARFLHAAAKAVVERHGGEVPMGRDELLALPGIGRYSAGSIASIIGQRREPIVDGNVSRVFARLFARRGAVNEPEHVQWSWERAQEFVDASHNPAAANEGLMEFGASVCTPAAPRCASCPLAKLCAARAQNSVSEIPAPKPRPAREEIVMVALRITRSDGAVLLEQRPRNGMWSSMWQPPTVEVANAARLSSMRVAKLMGVDGGVHRTERAIVRVGELSCITTHRAVRFQVYESSVRGKGAALEKNGRRFVAREELTHHAMSNAVKRVLALTSR